MGREISFLMFLPRPSSSRRQFLEQIGAGVGGLALATLLTEESLTASTTNNPLEVKMPHYHLAVKRVIMLFMSGGPSQLDTFDPKPLLTRDSGKPLAPEKRRGSCRSPTGWATLSARRSSFANTGRAGSGSARYSRTWPSVLTTSA